MKGLSIIIPVKPPEPYVETIKEQIDDIFEEYPHEILIQYEKGLTNAVIAGVQRSKFNVVAVMDADGSHNPVYLESMLRILMSEPYVLVIGSKYVKKGFDTSPFYRQIISGFYRILTQVLLDIEVDDPMSGFCMGYKYLYQTLEHSDDYKFLLQLLVHIQPLETKEIPIVFLQRQNGKSKASLSTGLTTLSTVIRMWKNKE